MTERGSTMNYELRRWKIDDAPKLALCANNKKIADNLRDAYPHPYTEADARAYIESCLAAGEQQQYTRAIFVEGEIAGSIGVFFGRDVYRRSGELGYWLAEPFWGKGVMSGAVREICRHLFETTGIVRIFAEPYAHNIGSRRVLEKSGFVLEGIMRSGVWKNNTLFDYCMYALLKDIHRS